MKFKGYLILVYAILAVVAAMIIAGMNSYYMSQQEKENIQYKMEIVSANIVSNYEDMIDKMQQQMNFLLSDMEALQAIRELSTMMSDADSDSEIAEIYQRKSIVSSAVVTAYNLDNCRRILVYNQYGYVASSRDAYTGVVDENKDISTIEWIGDFEENNEYNLLIPLHLDDWSYKEDDTYVISYVKEIQGDDLGYIEIQLSQMYLDDYFIIDDSNIDVIITLADQGELVYTSITEVSDVYMSDLIQKAEGIETGEFLDDTENDEIISRTYLSEYDVNLILVADRDSMLINMQNHLMISLVIGGAFLVCAIFFVVLMANVLTKPLVTLRKQMEQTQWSNIHDDIVIETRDDDVRALTQAYKELLSRLSASSIKEKQLAMLQLQAQFDMLQVQVNPHFLYNTLNIIASRGMANNDEEICRICADLAAMLRYSSDTQERISTVEQELINLNHYLHILKMRYEKRLDIQIDVDVELMKEKIPKITFQQLIENCIEHGFRNYSAQMIIKVTGKKHSNGWYIEVEDNGAGISDDRINEISMRITEIKIKLQKNSESLGFKIGGMGVANLYARLYYMYEESLIFGFIPRESASGTTIRLGVEYIDAVKEE